MKNKKAIIFDFDGTLSDTLGAITEAVNLTLSHFGFAEKSETEVQKAIGNGATMLIRRVVPQNVSCDTKMVTQVRKVYDDMYARTYLHTVNTYDGIMPTLTQLWKKRGIKLAVFSNKQDLYVKGLCEQLFPKGMIGCALGQTDLPIKPDPAGLFRILEELDVTPSECVFVGDSEVDFSTAQNAGIDFIGVSWGYSGRDRLISCGAENIADNAEEILKILNEGDGKNA